MGDYWRDIKEASRAYKQRKGWVSQQYKTEEDRQEGENWKHSANSNIDELTLKELKKLKLSPVRKNVHSFQINVKGRIGMYYTGKNQKLRYNDGETINLPYYNSLEEYLKKVL